MKRRNPARPVAVKGHALLMTLVLLAVLGAAVTSLFVSQAAAVEVTGDMISTRQAFYACDGISRSMVKLAQGYLKDVAEPDPDDMAEHVCAGAGMAGCTAAAAKLPNITPPGFTVIDFEVGMRGESFTSPLPSGPFRGMNARQTPVTLFVRAEKDSSGHACEASQEIVLAQIGLFQFFVFAEEFADLYNGPPMEIDGRVHINGDFCGHRYSNNDLRIKHLTAAGRIFAGSSSCPRSRPTSDSRLYFWDGGGWQQMDQNNDHGCTGCSGGWANYAPSRWNGHVLDKAHDVPTLKVPVSGTPAVQDGLNSDGDVQNNASTQRFLVDPPMFGHEVADPAHPGDTDEVLAQKFACKADIRIINGVWYRRSPGDDKCELWPGTPIWSDHPGRFALGPTDELGLVGTQSKVGQQDLEEELAWGYGTRPTRYSFYEADNNGLLLNDSDTIGVVSYGSLFRDTSADPDVFVPGMWAAKSTHSSSVGRFCGAANSNSSIDLRRADSYPCDCNGSSCVVHRRANYLQGTRSGIGDPRVDATDSSRMRILPMNFDVSAFAAALADNSHGELGSHFPPGSDFNGIIWITNTWTGQLNGFGNDGNDGAGKKLAELWPNPTANPAPGQPRSVTEDRSTGRLPYPLCGQTVAGNAFTDQAGSSGEFTVPQCSDASHPSALRIINGYTIDPVVFPAGLTIATNLPAYITGDFNKHSDDVPGDWRPVLVASDALTLLSNAFDDTESTWHSISSMTASSRDATSTHYRFALIAGDVSTAPGGGNQSSKWGGGINNFPRFIEDWKDSVPAELYGSMVIGFRSVFHRQKYRLAGSGEDVYNAPRRDWFYDTNFDVISNQPPGAPVYEVQAMKKWARN